MASQYRSNPNTNQIEKIQPTGEWSQSAFDTTYKGILGGAPVPSNPVNPTNPTPESVTGNSVLDAILSKIQGQETPEAAYNRLYSSSGIAGQETNVATAQQGVNEAQNQVSKVDDLLNNLEADINSRIGGSVMTEAMRRRELGVEGSPLRNQYAQLVKGQGVAQQGLTAAQSGLSNARTDFTNMYNAQTKQTPYEELLKTIAGEQAKNALNPPKVSSPTSKQEWDAAGGEAGTGMTYAKWLDRNRKADTTEADNKKIIDSFNKDLSSWNTEGTREQLIRQLRARYPDIDPNDIAKKVYEVYPDNFNK